MQKIFYNQQNKIRNGWWILIFIGLVVLSQPIYKPLKQMATSFGANASMLELISPLLILLITWICLRLRRQSLSDVGLKINLRWCKQLLMGFLLGCGLIALTVALIWSVGGIDFNVSRQWSYNLIWLGLYGFAVGAFFEELLHRGFIFQGLIDGLGIWPAQLLIATLFTVGHWGNPGMEGITQVVSSADLFIGSLIFGLAYIKTQSLALPIGLHLGWNWFQGNILGFSVSGHEATGILAPSYNTAPQWLSGGEFGPEASIFSVLMGVAAFTMLYVYKGNQANTEQTNAVTSQANKPAIVANN